MAITLAMLRRPWITVTIGLAICLMIVAGAMLLVDRVPPRPQTTATMQGLKRRILRFAHSNGRLPKTLGELPATEDLANNTQDGWGHPIILSVAPDGTVTLTSYGKDGVPGGMGDDADIIGTFQAKMTADSWADEQVQWIKPP